MRFLPALLVAAFVTLSTAHVLPRSNGAARALEPVFPLEIKLRDWKTNIPIDRPVGVVAGFDTTQYVVTVSGKIFLTDVRSGKGTLLNPGGDNQRFAGVCLDSRGPGTLYATGGDTGLVYAFNRRGQLLQKYRITSAAKDGGTAFLANCIQTRYQLLITDAYNPVIYYLELVDEGPLRGHPSTPNNSTKFQGIRMKYEGDWEQVGNGFNGYGVEWSQKFNETAYVMNTATGELFTIGIKSTHIIPEAEKVEIEGNVKLFPGALHMLFDSPNENVLYISIPHLNAIAVVEISGEEPRKAKFIRYLMNVLIDGPVALGEFGDWIYPVSGHFRRGKPRNGVYTVVQMPRHAQIVSSEDEDEEFTTYYDDKTQKKPELVAPAKVQETLTSSPTTTGKDAPALVPEASVDSRPPNLPGTNMSSATAEETPENSENPDGTDAGSDKSDSGSNSDEGATDSSDDTDASESTSPDETNEESSSTAPSTPSNDDDTADDDRPSAIFGAATAQPDDEEASACFPASATVHMENGMTAAMHELRIGDRVLCGWDDNGVAKFSDVYMFSHQDENIISSFVFIQRSDGKRLEVSPGHYMYVNGKLATASNVRIGDTIDTRIDRPIRVRSVGRVRRKGLYNPQTLCGDIVVEGLKVSTYTSRVEPVVASALLSPLRALHPLYRGWSGLLSRFLSHGSQRIPFSLPGGRLADH